LNEFAPPRQLRRSRASLFSETTDGSDARFLLTKKPEARYNPSALEQVIGPERVQRASHRQLAPIEVACAPQSIPPLYAFVL
jgi:hypothetical protein